MNGEQQTVQPDPVRIIGGVNAYQESAALKTAVELAVFTAIGEGATTPKQIAERCGASERGVRALCDFLVVRQYLTKDAGHYANGVDAAAFLDRRSPAYMGDMVEFLLAEDWAGQFDHLNDAVRQGGTAGHNGGSMSPENPVWVRFAESMGRMMGFPAQYAAGVVGPLEGEARVLDVAAGHGLFGIHIAQQNPQARVTAQDWPQVLEVASRNAAQAGLDGRFQTLPGDALDLDFGGPYDLALVTHFLHHFDEQTNIELLRKVRGSLVEGGQAVIVDFIVDEDRVSPPMQAAFSLMMLAETPGGQAYTRAEFERMLGAAGFRDTSVHQQKGIPQSVIVSRR